MPTPMPEKSSPPLSGCCHPLMLLQLFQTGSWHLLKTTPYSPVGIQRVFIPSSMHFHRTPPVSSIPNSSTLTKSRKMTSSWANYSQQTNHLHETQRYHHHESHHPIQPSIPFHCQNSLVRFQAYHSRLFHRVQLPCNALQAVHRRAGPSQLSEQGLLHLENHLREGDADRRCWLVPGEEAFVSILKNPVPSGVAAQARLGEEYLVYPDSCLGPYHREQF